METSPLKAFGDFVLQRKRMSQSDEQTLISEFFDFKTDGFYVDVGANDPVSGSTTWHLDKAGWRGLAIDPLPDMAEKLRAERTAEVFNCACSAPEDDGKSLPFYVHDVANGWSTFNHDISQWVGWGDENVRQIMVPTRTLNGILEEAKAPRGFELLAMDVEFHELQVLKGFDLDYWQPQLIFTEDHAYDHNLVRYITSNGYKFLRRTNMDSWFVPKSHPQNPSLNMWYAYFRKYYIGLPVRRLKNAIRK